MKRAHSHLRIVSSPSKKESTSNAKEIFQTELVESFMTILPLKNTSSIPNYSTAIKGHFLPWLEDRGKYLWEIEPDEFDEFTKYLISNVQQSTAWNYVNYVSQLYDWVVSRKNKVIQDKFGVEIRNPIDKWNTPKKKNDDDSLPELPDQDVVNYYMERLRYEVEKAIKENKKRFIIVNGRQLAAEQIMIKGGLRVEEVSNIMLSHINYEHMSLLVYKGKGNKDRIVDMTKGLADILRWYTKNIHPLLPQSPEFASDVPLFISERGKKLSKKTLMHKNWKLQDTFGIEIDKRFSPHGERRLYASNLYVELIDQKHPDPIMYIKIQLGHEYLSTTLRYCKIPKSFLNRKRLDILKDINCEFEGAEDPTAPEVQ